MSEASGDDGISNESGARQRATQQRASQQYATQQHVIGRSEGAQKRGDDL
jgi:hypothetical protein